MSSLRALLPTAMAVVAILLAHSLGPALLQRLRLFLSYPAYGASPLCLHCIAPLPHKHCHFCPTCMLPLTGFAATDPILRIATMGCIYRRASRRLAGVGLVGVLLFIAVPSTIGVLSALEGQTSLARVSLVTAIPWGVVLAKAIAARREATGGGA